MGNKVQDSELELYACSVCSKTLALPYLFCPKCSEIVVYSSASVEKSAISSINSIWDLDAFFPPINELISMQEGNTPIIPVQNFEGLQGLNVKLEFRNPTGSFRDRAASLIVSDAISRGIRKIVGVSTGSFSLSLAAYCSRAKIESVNVLPFTMELPKISQLKIYGSEVIRKGQTLEAATIHAEKLAAQEEIYPMPQQNLLMIEGQKTIGLEIAYANPDIESIIIPKGSGSLILSIYQGYKAALESDWISEIPKFFAISLEETTKSYLVESLEVHQSELFDAVTMILEKTGGTEISINPDTMVSDALQLAKKEGFFIEPAAASVISGAKSLKENGLIDLENSVAILSGSGFNSINVFAEQMRETKKAVWGVSGVSNTKYEILDKIAQGKANYGYSLWVALGKSTSKQSIYQHLTDLEEKGLIEYTKDGLKKIYRLSRIGKETYLHIRDILSVF